MNKNKKVKIMNVLARANENYTVTEKKLLLEIINLWQTNCNSVKGEPSYEINIDRRELTSLGELSRGRRNKLYSGLSSKSYKFKENDKDVSFNPIKEEIVENDNVIRFVLNEECSKYFSHKAKGKFYFYELDKMFSISSAKAIKLYEILKHHNGNGLVILKLDNCREIFNIPKTYTTANIKTQTIDNSLRLLKEVFGDFVTNVKYTKKYGKFDRVDIFYKLKETWEESFNIEEIITDCYNGEINSEFNVDDILSTILGSKNKLALIGKIVRIVGQLTDESPIEYKMLMDIMENPTAGNIKDMLEEIEKDIPLILELD